MAQKILIIGSGGQLGAELVREFAARGFDAVGLGRSALDITDGTRVEESIASHDPAVVLNAAAYNQVDVAEQEPQAALGVNALAVRNLAMACRQRDAQMVHFSTDYVFDGMASRPYTEEDIPRPLSAYGVSKLAGEHFAQAYLERPLVVRTSGVFGPGGLKTARGNFIESMLRLASAGKPIRIVADSVASPTYAPALAARTADLVQQNQTGLFHIGGGTPISWFEYARMIFEIAGMEPALSAADARQYRTTARRPKYSVLSNGKMERLGLQPMPALEEAIKSYFAEREKITAKAQT